MAKICDHPGARIGKARNSARFTAYVPRCEMSDCCEICDKQFPVTGAILVRGFVKSTVGVEIDMCESCNTMHGNGIAMKYVSGFDPNDRTKPVWVRYAGKFAERLPHTKRQGTWMKRV